jgi:hypothetical protein
MKIGGGSSGEFISAPAAEGIHTYLYQSDFVNWAGNFNGAGPPQ